MGHKAKVGDEKKAIGYVRVSTDDQNLGPDAQRAAIARWAQANGIEIVAVHEDLGVSGGAELDKRPGLLAALDAIQDHGAGVLLVAKRDRLARDVLLAAMIERLALKAGAKVRAADGSANGDGPEAVLMRTILDAFAQYERALIRARTRAALSVKRARGERVGVVPFGFRLGADSVHLEPDGGEQVALERVHALRAEGLTTRAIADRLNDEGVRGRGVRWHQTTVARLVQVGGR